MWSIFFKALSDLQDNAIIIIIEMTQQTKCIHVDLQKT